MSEFKIISYLRSMSDESISDIKFPFSKTSYKIENDRYEDNYLYRSFRQILNSEPKSSSHYIKIKKNQMIISNYNDFIKFIPNLGYTLLNYIKANLSYNGQIEEKMSKEVIFLREMSLKELESIDFLDQTFTVKKRSSGQYDNNKIYYDVNNLIFNGETIAEIIYLNRLNIFSFNQIKNIIFCCENYFAGLSETNYIKLKNYIDNAFKFRDIKTNKLDSYENTNRNIATTNNINKQETEDIPMAIQVSHNEK